MTEMLHEIQKKFMFVQRMCSNDATFFIEMRTQFLNWVKERVQNLPLSPEISKDGTGTKTKDICFIKELAILYASSLSAQYSDFWLCNHFSLINKVVVYT